MVHIGPARHIQSTLECLLWWAVPVMERSCQARSRMGRGQRNYSVLMQWSWFIWRQERWLGWIASLSLCFYVCISKWDLRVTDSCKKKVGGRERGMATGWNSWLMFSKPFKGRNSRWVKAVVRKLVLEQWHPLSKNSVYAIFCVKHSISSHISILWRTIWIKKELTLIFAAGNIYDCRSFEHAELIMAWSSTGF